MFGNLISTDLVAAPPPVLIDKLTDIFEYNRKPLFDPISGLKFSTSRNKIWRSLWNSRHRLVKTMADMQWALDDMAINGSVLLTIDGPLSILERMYCMKELSKNRNMFYKGKQRIGQVNEARILNVNISSYLRKSINRAHVAFEMYGMRKKTTRLDFAEMVLGKSPEVDRCLASNGYQLNRMISVKPIDIYNVRYLTSTLLFALIFGTLLIGYEFLTRYRRKVLKSLRKVTRAIRNVLFRKIEE